MCEIIYFFAVTAHASEVRSFEETKIQREAMDRQVEDPGRPPSPPAGKKTNKSSSCQQAIEEAQVTKNKKKKGNKEVFTRWHDDETAVALKARVRGLLALVNTIRSKQHTVFVNRNLHAAIHIRRCALLKQRPVQLRYTSLEGHPLSDPTCTRRG